MTYIPPLVLGRRLLQNMQGFDDSSYMHWTPTTPDASLQKATFSLWYDYPHDQDADLLTAHVAPGGLGDGEFFRVDSSGYMRFQSYTSGSLTWSLIGDTAVTKGKVSHYLWEIDFGKATQNDRVVMYVDNVRQTLGTNTIPASSSLYLQGLTQARAHALGRYQVGATNYARGLIGDVNLVIGQALSPDNFGQDVEGTWVWKDYEGTHGANGKRFQFLTFDPTVDTKVAS